MTGGESWSQWNLAVIKEVRSFILLCPIITLSACFYIVLHCPHIFVIFNSLRQEYCLFFTSLLLLLCHIIFTAGPMDIAHNTTTTLECHGRSLPSWYMNGYLVLSGTLYMYDPSTGDLIGILTIDGNKTCGIVNVSCRLEGQIVYTERLNISGLYIYNYTSSSTC